MLVAYTLHKNWDAKITLSMSTTPRRRKRAYRYLDKLVYEARFPLDTGKQVTTRNFADAVKDFPAEDVHIIPIKDESQIPLMKELSKIEKSFLFITDSGKEDVLS